MLVQTATHATLLARLTDGADGVAWAQFRERYATLIRGFCQKRGLQPADCDDIEQDVLLSLSKSMGQFKYDPAKGLFRSYLKTVVMNAISRKWRQNPSMTGLSQADGIGAAGDDDTWEQEWRQYHFRQAMKTIESEFSESDRRAFMLYAVEGRAATEAAAEVGISVDAVYQAKSRVLKRLAAVIETQISEEG